MWHKMQNLRSYTQNDNKGKSSGKINRHQKIKLNTQKGGHFKNDILTNSNIFVQEIKAQKI